MKLRFLLINVLVLLSTNALSFQIEEYSQQIQRYRNSGLKADVSVLREGIRWNNFSESDDLEMLRRGKNFFYMGSFSEAYQELKGINEEKLSTHQYVDYLELRFKVALELADKNYVRKRVSSLSRETKYLHFLQSGDIFNLTKNLISKSHRRHFEKYAIRSLSDFPYTEASLEAFRYFQQCSENEKIPYRIVRKLARFSHLTPGVREFILQLLDSDKVQWRGYYSKKRFLSLKVRYRLKNFSDVIDKGTSLMSQKIGKSQKIRIADLVAKSYEAKGDFGKAATFFEESLRRLGRNSKTIRLWRNYGRFLERRNNFIKAADEFSRLTRFSSSRHNRWSSFWTKFKARDFKAAFNVISSRRTRPLDRSMTDMKVYWKARSLEGMGKAQEAMKLDRDIIKRWGRGYYASLVMNRYFKRSNLEFIATLPKIKPISQSNIIGNTFDVRFWYRDQLERISRYPRSLSELVSHIQENRKDWEAKYPRPYWSKIQEIADYWRFDPLIMLSIIRTESFYNTNAKSPVGARGLMQIMPYTGYSISRDLRDENFSDMDLIDPTINIYYGGFYIAKLVNYYRGNLPYAIAAYNAGPHKVDEWLKTCEGCPFDEFVDGIPFRETRQYVKKVLAGYSMYLRIYQDKLYPPLNKKFERSPALLDSLY